MDLTVLGAIPLVTGIVEVLKRTKGLAFLDGRYEITALVIAVVIALVGNLGLVNGILIGLSSMGLYDGVSTGVEKVRTLL